MKRAFVLAFLVLVAAIGFAGGEGEEAAGGDYTLTPPGEFPIVEGSAELTFALPWNEEHTVEETWNTIEYEKMTGVHVNWLPSPFDAYIEKRSIMIASGDLPDAFVNAISEWSFTAADELNYGSQGVFIPLNDLIEEQTVWIKAMFDERPELMPFAAAPDGNLYTLPEMNVCYHCNVSGKGWMNHTWLSRLGLEMPETTEELYDVLVAFRDQDANGNGDPNDEIPLMTSVDGWHHSLDVFIMNAFTYNDGITWLAVNEQGQVESVVTKPEYREGLRFLNKLYEEGLIAPETFAQSRTNLVQVNESGESTMIGMGLGGWMGMIVGGRTVSDRWKEYEIMAPISGPSGYVSAANYTFERDINTGTFAITSAADDPALAMRWIDWMYSLEGTLFHEDTGGGREGIEWRAGEPGELDFNGNPARWVALDTPEDDPFYEKVVWSQIVPSYRSAAYREAWAAPQDYYGDDFLAGEVQLFVRSHPYYEVIRPTELTMPPTLFVEEQYIGEYTRLRTTYLDYVKESLTKFIVGSFDVESDWDRFLDTLESNGLSRYLELSQQAYDLKF